MNLFLFLLMLWWAVMLFTNGYNLIAIALVIIYCSIMGNDEANLP